MSTNWSQVSSPRFIAAAGVAFLALELAVRIKLGSMLVLASLWIMACQALTLRLGKPGHLNAFDRFLLAMYTSSMVAIFIFLVFGAGNAVLRTIDPAWRFLQLP